MLKLRILWHIFIDSIQIYYLNIQLYMFIDFSLITNFLGRIPRSFLPLNFTPALYIHSLYLFT